MLRLILFFICLSLSLFANEKVVLQLKWFHQFQFAGYYAAKEKGFYEDVGLDVEIKQRDLNFNNIQQVIDNEAQYGVADSVLLLYKTKNEPVVIVSPIFQHSPSILIYLKNSELNSVYDLEKKDMLFYDSDTDGFSILAMLKKLGVSPNIQRGREKDDYKKLIDKKTNAFPAYLSNEPFYFKEKNLDIGIVDPKNYGFDLYGDMLFTNEKEAKEHPDRVRRFKEATLKGWEYALDNQDEIIDLIHKKYNSKKSIKHLKFEAQAIERVVSKETIPLGTVDEGRIKYIQALYKEYGLSNSDIDVKDFIFEEYQRDTFLATLTKEENEYLKNKSVLKVQNLQDFPPFNFNQNGKALGFTIDYFKILSEYLGVKIEYVEGTWAEHLQMLKDGKLDIIPHIAKSEDREMYVDYSSFKVFDYTPSLVIRKDSIKSNLNDLDGKRVAVLDKSFIHKKLKEEFPNIILKPVSTPSEVVLAVSNNSVDAGVDNLSLLEYYININWLSNLKTISLDKFSAIKKEPLYMGVSKGNRVLKSILDKTNDVIAHNEIIALKKKWINKNSSSTNRDIFSYNELRYLDKKEELHMCIDPNWMPFEKIVEGKHVGITSDYMKLFEQYLHIPIKLVQTKGWLETIEFAKSRKCDFITSMSETTERKELFTFTNSLMNVPIVVATKIDKPFINGILDIKDKTIGIVKGFGYKEILKKKYPNLKLLEVKGAKDGLERVNSGEIYGFIGVLQAVGYTIQKNHFNTLKIAGKLNDSWAFPMATRNDELHLSSIFNKIINNISDETHNKILNKWVSIKFQESIDYTKLVWIVVIFLIIIAIIVYKNRSINDINEKMQKYIDVIDEHVLTSTTDKHGIIISTSQAFCDISGYTKDELLGQNHRLIKHPEMRESLFKGMWKTILLGKIWKGEIKNRRKDGSFYWVHATVSPNFDNKGNIIGFTSIRHDITDKKKIEEISITDELTTLFNKRYFNEMIEKEINRAKRDERYFAFIIFDIDHFKQYNDNYGHQKGDEVLELVGKTIKSFCKRSSDVAFRIGGEEFGVIFSPDSEEIAVSFTENLRLTIESLNIEHKYSSVGDVLTVSIGLYCDKGLDIKDSKEIYKLADLALYEAKKSGRNKYSVVI